jgi:hypothetical protein
MEIDFKEDLLLVKISRIVDKKTGKALGLNFTYVNDETGEYRYLDKSGIEKTGRESIEIVEKPLSGNTPPMARDRAIRMIAEKLKDIRK